MTESYTGRARILDRNGVLVDVGKANLVRLDPESGSMWGGTIRIFANAALADKSMDGIIDLDNGNRARALVGPRVGGVIDGELVDVRVVPLQDDVPF